MRLGSESCRAIGSSLRVEQLLATASVAAQQQIFQRLQSSWETTQSTKNCTRFSVIGKALVATCHPFAVGYYHQTKPSCSYNCKSVSLSRSRNVMPEVITQPSLCTLFLSGGVHSLALLNQWVGTDCCPVSPLKRPKAISFWEMISMQTLAIIIYTLISRIRMPMSWLSWATWKQDSS